MGKVSSEAFDQVSSELFDISISTRNASLPVAENVNILCVKSDNPEERVLTSDAALPELLVANGVPEEVVLDIDDCDEKDSEEDGIELTEDIYSLMYTSELFSSAFFYALFCNMFQYIFIVLVLIDVLNNRDGNNRFNLPPGAPVQVKIGQAFALLLALSMQNDLLTGIIYLHRGHRCLTIGTTLPGATTVKWYLAAFAQLAAGAGLNFVIFVLVMQSKDIIGMFLNFAALMFISEIDDIGFKLADNGFITKSLRSACDDVRRVKLTISEETNTTYRRVLFAVMASCLYVEYTVLTYRQSSGQFLCQRIFVQLGGSEFAGFSGVYVQTTENLMGQRATYIEEKPSSDGTADPLLGRIGYCSSENAWTFYLGDTPCDWAARSPHTAAFDPTSVSNWLMMKEGVVYSSVFLSCFDDYV